MKKNGFTLIELVMVIIILGILAAVAIPKFFDLQSKAKESAELGVVGSVKAGIHNYYAKHAIDNPGDQSTNHWPTQLDGVETGTSCSTTNPCFGAVLEQGGITSGDWSKTGAASWTGPNGTSYSYSAADGSFK